MSEKDDKDDKGKKPPPDEPVKTPETYSINDWEIKIIDGDKVQLDQDKFKEIIGIMNNQVNVNTEFVKKTMSKEKDRILTLMKKANSKAAKKYKDKSVQELEMIYESWIDAGIIKDDGTTTTEEEDEPEEEKKRGSPHNTSENKLGAGTHSPLSLLNKEENIYNCTCGKSHKLDEFYS